ncbi:MAG: hypothetical protein ACRCV9_02685 [Burkholderiaceae bacterium]
MAFIVTELFLVFGGALAFAWWQLRDLKKEAEKRRATQPPKSQTDVASSKSD